MRTRIPPITTILAMLLLIPAAAGAALVDEQRQGQNLIAQLNAGTKTCSDLWADHLDHIGEYVIFKALGHLAAPGDERSDDPDDRPASRRWVPATPAAQLRDSESPVTAR
jgi:hypothetical protein